MTDETPDLMEALRRSLTRPSSGDRPAEEAWNGRSSPECTPRCGTRGTDRIVHDHATPPAVRTGDDVAAVEPTRKRMRVLAERIESLHLPSREEREMAARFRELDAALSTPPPVSGTVTRDDVGERLRFILDRGIPAHAAPFIDFDGIIRELLALGGSQPAE